MANDSIFKTAERGQSKLRLAITGPSGAGKTFSALKIAAGLVPGGRIAVIDTEAKSAELYAGLPGIPSFSCVDFSPPFTTENYLRLIKIAQNEGFDLLIIDSISHQWDGAEGSIKYRKDSEELARSNINTWTNWAKYSPEHDKFKMALIHTPMHMIATMRSKTSYIAEINDKGRTAPKKMGLQPIQRDGIEYEFAIVFDMNIDHIASVSKDRTGIFAGQSFKPDAETGKIIKDWIASGKAEAAQVPTDKASMIKEIMELMAELSLSPEDASEILMKECGVKSLKSSNIEHLTKFLGLLKVEKEAHDKLMAGNKSWDQGLKTGVDELGSQDELQ